MVMVPSAGAVVVMGPPGRCGLLRASCLAPARPAQRRRRPGSFPAADVTFAPHPVHSPYRTHRPDGRRWACRWRLGESSVMSADQILEALDPDQRAVALALRGPVCVLAGAGTGKTRAITHRIAYGVRTGAYPPTSVLAVTFTARAAGEMRTRLRDLGVVGVQARTFHAAALRQLGFFWPKVVGGAPPRILEHKAPAVADAAGRLSLSVDRIAIRDLASEVEWAKVSLVTADDYVRATTAIDRPAPAGFDRHTVARLITAYEDVKTERGVIDFEDVLLMLADMLAGRTDVAETVRAQYRHFV